LARVSDSGRKLGRAFYNRPTLQVAEELLGKYIIYHSSAGLLSARIVEVEAYVGEDDPASHAAPGPTKRNALMYGKPGVAYIYFIYGMYHCLNFVTEQRGYPAAILMRAAEPTEGLEILKHRNLKGSESLWLSGPGKFCRGFGLGLEQNGMDLTGSVLYLEDRGESPANIERSARIGIRKGLDRDWRFFDASSKAVSGRKSAETREDVLRRDKRAGTVMGQQKGIRT
jgi:DNA-3-methyladenine glycosylase